MNESIHPELRIETLIHLIRGQRVMLSSDLARLYGVPAKALIQAVKRNKRRFPPDFMFPLTRTEIRDRSQFVTCGRILRARNVLAFTEQGVAMLSCVLRSERAMDLNVLLMRAFVKLREALLANVQLAAKLAELEQKVTTHDAHIQALYDAVRELMTPPEPPPKQIGFHACHERNRMVKEGRVAYGRRRVSRS